MKIIFSLLILLIFSGCYNTTQPMKTINTTLPKGKFINISKQESKSTFALTKLITDIDRGETIFAFPAKPPTKGYLCNYTTQGDGEVTYSGGKKYLGDWSSELGDIFFDTLTRLGYNIAGDPKDLFNANTSVSSAEYLIAGRVVKMAGNFCSDHDFWYALPTNKYSGEMSITVEWSVLNTLTKNIVLNETTTGYSKLEKPEKQGITTVFENAFAISTEIFAKSSTLRNLAVGKKIVATNENNSKNEIKIEQGKSQKEFNINNLKSNIPIVVKISPDIDENQIEVISEILLENKIEAIIISNTSESSRDKLSDIQKHQKGGLSGKPIEKKSNVLISKFYKLFKGKIKIIGVGGVDSGAAAHVKFLAGADFIQLYTGMVFKGPNIASIIKKDLKELLIRDGVKNFTEIVGNKTLS